MFIYFLSSYYHALFIIGKKLYLSLISFIYKTFFIVVKLLRLLSYERVNSFIASVHVCLSERLGISTNDVTYMFEQQRTNCLGTIIIFTIRFGREVAEKLHILTLKDATVCVFVFFNLFLWRGGNVYVSDYNLIIVSPPHKKLFGFFSFPGGSSLL